MSDEIEKVEQAPEQEAEKAEPTVEVEPTTNEGEGNTGNVDPVSIQAARFAYIEHLGKVMDDGVVTPDELNDIAMCKSQVLVELVGLIDFTSKLPADSPLKKAAAALEKHLYKCYEKTDRIQLEARSMANLTRYRKDVEHALYGANGEFRKEPFQGFFQTYTDDSLMPGNNIINLKGLGLSVGSVGMLSQLINSPGETLKAQLPNLLEEFTSKITGGEQTQAGQFFNTLLTNLSGLKSERSMLDALEGKNITANLLSLVGGKGL